ncbi:hypothetical protein [Novacetimonas hansenii]|nr:hypothetical protein [Novacetimonas hansenii]WEQ58294.1 hypothetical protein LV563_10540 [Novacetimonas hansenii]
MAQIVYPDVLQTGGFPNAAPKGGLSVVEKVIILLVIGYACFLDTGMLA